MAEAVSARGLTKEFPAGKGKKITALGGVDLTINEGEIFGLLGPNGAGKTTMISILSGIISPDRGEARIFGSDCVRETKKVQRQLNVVSGFTGVPSSISCEEALMYYCLLYNVRDAKSKIDSVIGATDLEEVRDKPLEDFSSGMKQRYIIAKGLLNDPKLLILDEPTVGLDVESAINIRNIIRQLHKEGRTILLTTHNMFEAEELCNRIAFINHGQIVATGTAAQLKEKVVSKRTIEIYCSKESCVVDTLSRLPGVEAKVKSPTLVQVSVDNYKRTKDILKALAGCDSEIFSISELEPTLEETYLKLINSRNGEMQEKRSSTKSGVKKTAGRGESSEGDADA